MDSNEIILIQLAEKIVAENKTFKKLSNDEKKVVIAEDCILRIKAEQLKPNCGTFIKDTHDIQTGKLTLKNQLNRPNLVVRCEACAKGSLFLSVVGRINKFNKKELHGGNGSDNLEHQKLLEIFTIKELAYIEFAFEGTQYIGRNTHDDDYIEFTLEEKVKARQFYANYGGNYEGEFDNDSFETWTINNEPEDDRARMLAICENIIANKGHFIL